MRIIKNDMLIEFSITHNGRAFEEIYARLKEKFPGEQDPLCGATIIDGVFKMGAVVWDFSNTTFKNCVFENYNFLCATFKDCYADSCTFEDCTFNGNEGLTITNPVKPKVPDNKEIAEKLHCHVVSLPNPSFAKIVCECDFCHRKFERIVKRKNAEPFLLKVPNCDRRVCEQCYRNYELRSKEYGNRHYGYSGSLSYYRTPMDKHNTAILGLEMEFEGDFFGWKELQDAHQGTLFYGYDSSVDGQNELSWDCGSYSWWKYLAPLKQVCAALRKGGAHEGPTAGVHIHVSRPDVSVSDVTAKINKAAQTGCFKTLFEAVSLRTNKEKFERYANLRMDINEHHAGISYNRHGTCEFRVFACSLDPGLLLKRLLLCKTIFNSFADGKDSETTMFEFSNDLKKFIMNCAEIQRDNEFITPTATERLRRALYKTNKEVK